MVNFEPLRTRFNQVYGASKLYLPGMDELPAMKTYIDMIMMNNPRKFKPVVPGYDKLEELLSLGFKNSKPII